MINFIWFTDEIMFIMLALNNLGRYGVGYLSSQKLDRLANSVCWCSVLLERAKVKLFPQARFGHFFLYNGTTSPFLSSVHEAG